MELLAMYCTVRIKFAGIKVQLAAQVHITDLASGPYGSFNRVEARGPRCGSWT